MDLLVLNQLTISNLRNISDVTIRPAHGINLILGDNGSGKTTLLEAIHLLALGRSFRTRTLKNAVQFGQQKLQIVAKIKNDIPVGLLFDLTDGLQIRLNSARVKKLSELASQLPLQMIPANCHQFFEQGPRYRRQLLDWGVFHVEPDFNYHWQSYRRVLQQRNSALRQCKQNDEIQLWDNHLANHGEQISRLRQQYLESLLDHFKAIFSRLCPEYLSATYSLRYQSGWQKEQSLKDVLSTTVERDKQLAYTRSGCHAADWTFKVNDSDPSTIFSRGQQKLFFLALCMAQQQAVVVNSIAKGNAAMSEIGIIIIDDISSELDDQHQMLVLTELANLHAQSFITSTDLSLSKSIKTTEQNAVFHVKQGVVSNKDETLS